MVANWKHLPTDPAPPDRPKNGFGTIGKPIRLRSNHFKIEIKNTRLVLYHYDVTIKDCFGVEDMPKKKKMRIFETMKGIFPKVFNEPLGFDCQKNAYSVKLFPQFSKKQETYEVILPDGVRKEPMSSDTKNRSKYTVALVKVNSATLQDLFSAYSSKGGCIKEASNVIQMCEVMFKHNRATIYEQIGPRSFFSKSNEFGPNFTVSESKEGQVGFFASLRPASWKNGLPSLTMNIDTAYAAFHKDIHILEFLQVEGIRDFKKPLQPRDIMHLNKLLKGLRIRTLHSPIPRTYKIIEITKQGANRMFFQKEVGDAKTKMSVVQYFSNDLKHTLKYPELNCLHVGNPAKTNYIPIECCKIDKGQKVQKKLSDMETREFIKSTAVPPAQRLNNIMGIVKKNNFCTDPVLKALTFTVADTPLQTNGRVLPPPALLAQRKTIIPRDGKWNSTNFHKGAILKHWAVINYDNRTREDNVRQFIGKIVSIGNQMGMQINNPFDFYQSRNPNPAEDIKYYKQQNAELQMVFFVLSRSHYGEIKLAGDRHEKLITQCVLSKNVLKCQDQLIRNILLKINAKMGGIHTVVGPSGSMLDVLNFGQPVLVMGADVNHPAAGDSTMPSLAAVVGSMDQCASRYSVEVRAQNHRTEIIMDMQQITTNLLKCFFKNTGRKPERILMYRDGVSESQFQEVLSSEMRKMRDGCTSLQKGYTPGITFVCVQKRHHTRLFCDERDGVGRHKNVPPGTIVDRDITHPKENDFFLVSHEGIQGTSRPTHYHLLWDDNDIPVNDLQMITYKLCHVYSRCTRSVSIPTPAYYAHLAAFRAKTHAAAYLEMNVNKLPNDPDKLFKIISQEVVNTSFVDKNSLYNELYYV